MSPVKPWVGRLAAAGPFSARDLDLYHMLVYYAMKGNGMADKHGTVDDGAWEAFTRIGVELALLTNKPLTPDHVDQAFAATRKEQGDTEE